MAAERFYIHRQGGTTSCALTAHKANAELPLAAEAGPWQYWMTVTRFQVEDGRLGFVFHEAVARIEAEGFFLFTGSPKLLGQPSLAVVSERKPDDV